MALVAVFEMSAVVRGVKRAELMKMAMGRKEARNDMLSWRHHVRHG